jgi:RimJ/RimL family protein N-acetyltransferase
MARGPHMTTRPPVLFVATRDRATAQSIVIRTAQLHDALGLATLMRTASHEPDGHFIHRPGELPDLPRISSHIAAALASDRRLLLVAECSGRMVGRLSIRGERRERLAHRGTFSILVARDHRGAGIGTAMIRAMLAWVGDHPRLSKVSLNVVSTNTRARRLYESLGFVVEGVRDRGVHLSNGRYVDDLIMSIWIDKPTSG